MKHWLPILLLIVALAPHTSAQGDPLPANVILFTALCESGQTHVFFITPDGQEVHEWTTYNALSPRWTAGGERVTLLAYDGSLWGVYNVDTSGSGYQVPMLEGDNYWLADLYSDFVWSPDSAYIAYVREPRLWVIDSSGVELAPPVPASRVGRGLSWSPDSRQLAFVGEDGQIHALDLDNSASSLTDDLLMGNNPAWSPDGRFIAFSAYTDGELTETSRTELYVIALEDGERRLVSDDLRLAVEGIQWSPDSQQIAFEAYTPSGDGTDVYVVSRDGSDLTRLTDSDGYYRNPSWSPDSKQLVFTYQPGDNSAQPALAVVNANGTDFYRLTDGGAWVDEPQWRPTAAGVSAEPPAEPVSVHC